MINKLIIILFCILTLNTTGQEAEDSFFNRKNQHSFSFEPIAVSYDYTYRFSELFGVGARIKTGLGFRFPFETYVDFEYIDFITLQIQYRFLFPEYFHLDIGPQVSFGTMDGFNDFIGINYGISAAGFFHYKRLQVGCRLHGLMYNGYYKEYDNNGIESQSSYNTSYEFLFSPLVIGITF